MKKPFLNHAGVKLLIGIPSFHWRYGKRCAHFEYIVFLRNWEINVLPFSLHGFPAPFRRRFPALPCGVIAGYPMQTVMRFSRCGAGFGNKKSPHNNLNLTIPSGMALVRVCYVAIRKLKTCSGSFGSRAGTPSKYVILNCRDRLPQKSSRVNVNLSGRGPSILLRKTVLSLKSPTGAFIAPLRKRALLRTRHFRQCARKDNENFGKKREGWAVPALLTRKNTRLFIIIKL